VTKYSVYACLRRGNDGCDSHGVKNKPPECYVSVQIRYRDGRSHHRIDEISSILWSCNTTLSSHPSYEHFKIVRFFVVVNYEILITRFKKLIYGPRGDLNNILYFKLYSTSLHYNSII